MEIMNDIAFMFLMMMLGFGVPLSLALWRYWSKVRTRALALPYNDSQMLLYQMTESLSRLGFKRRPGEGNQVVFEPGGMQKAFGLMPITVQFQIPGTAQAVGGSRFISYLKRVFPNAREQAYSGPSPATGWIKTFAKVYIGIMLLLALLTGGSYLYDRSQRRPDGTSANDVEQVLELSARDAARGVEWNVSIEKTGKIFLVTVPPGSKDGDRVLLRGKGKSHGDLYIVLHVK
jgi:DnaJ-like protein